MHSLGNDISLGHIAGGDTKLLFPRDLRNKHLYVCGSTGTGKSKFLEHLIRQDIVAWRKNKCGLILLDPHGSVYDSLMKWLAVWKLDRPIVPIDLRQDKWVVAYNVLRQRPSADPSVLIDNFTDAMAYVWGQEGTQRTPLFARWAANVLGALYENNLTLVDAQSLLSRSQKQLRYALTHDLSDTISREEWMFADTLSPKDFDTQVSSTVNRLVAFIKNQTMRAIFGQKDVSLDLGRAMDEGSIILVNLATEGGKISSKNANLFATLLMSDLWTAAQERGKGERAKPFYVYIDEFQRFVTPTIAENLYQARGFGLHMTMAHQFPNQLLNEGAAGKKVLDSAMENASTKVVFRLQNPENLKRMAELLFMGVMDPDEIKHELYSTKVMEYREESRDSITESYSESSGGTSQKGGSRGHGEGGTETFPHDEHDDDPDPMSVSESWSEFESHSESRSASHSKSSGISRSTGSVLIPVMGKELSHVQFRSLEEQLFRAMAVLFDQRERQGVARIVGMKAPVSLQTPTIRRLAVSEARMAEYAHMLASKLPFSLPRELADKQVAALAGEVADLLTELEPQKSSVKRKIT